MTDYPTAPKLSVQQRQISNSLIGTCTSQLALITALQAMPDKAQPMPHVFADPLLIVGPGGSGSGHIGEWVSETALLAAQPRRSRRRPTMLITGSDDPTAIKNGSVDDPLLTARQSADELNISLPGFWKGVAEGNLPAPVYVLPRAPRWRRSELRAVLETRRMLPAEAKLARKQTYRKVI